MIGVLDTVRLRHNGQEVTVIGFDTDHDGSRLVEIAWDTDGKHYKRFVSDADIFRVPDEKLEEIKNDSY